jgi:hypothetical protein
MIRQAVTEKEVKQIAIQLTFTSGSMPIITHSNLCSVNVTDDFNNDHVNTS